MAEPFVFHFKPDAHGNPLSMYIADLSCRCSLCGHPQYQRFYHATPLHSFTLPKLKILVAQLPQKVDYSCENCGEQVQPEAVAKSVLRYAFADDSGELVIYTNHQESPAASQYVVSPKRRLDPQVQPSFDPPTQVLVLDELSDETFWRYLGRPLNMKQHWRDSFAAFTHQEGEGAYTSAKIPDYIVGIATSQESLSEALQQAYQSLDEGEETMFEYQMDDSASYRLVDETDIGSWRRWLPPSVVHKLDQEEWFAGALVSIQPACGTLDRGFEVARLTWTTEGNIRVYSNITTPRGDLCEDEVRTEDVMHRAVYCGLSVGEAARLTLEEVVGRLLQVW